MKRSLVAVAGAILWLVLPVIASSSSCNDCHKDPRFYVQNKKIYTYYQHWLLSPHKAADVQCHQCHGGDPSTQDKETAHMGIARTSNPESKVFYKNQPKTCAKCHPQVSERFTQSRHYKALIGTQTAPTCSTCHRSMNRKPYYRTIVESTCVKCHNKQHIGTAANAAAQALEILDRLNITKGYLGWTALYYKEKNWPDNTKQELDEFSANYHKIIANGHKFDLLKSDEESIELLTQLKGVFRKAWKRKQTDMQQ